MIQSYRLEIWHSFDCTIHSIFDMWYMICVNVYGLSHISSGKKIVLSHYLIDTLMTWCNCVTPWQDCLLCGSECPRFPPVSFHKEDIWPSCMILDRTDCKSLYFKKVTFYVGSMGKSHKSSSGCFSILERSVQHHANYGRALVYLLNRMYQ